MPSSDSLSADGSLPSNDTFSTSPNTTPDRPLKEDRNVTWSGLTQRLKKRQKEQEQDTAAVSSNSCPHVERKETYELKDWPRKTGRLRAAVAETVRSLRRDKLTGGASTTENTPEAGEGAEMKSETEARKPKSARLLRKKFSFLKDRRHQRSKSESNLGAMRSSHDDMGPLQENGAAKHSAKKLIRRSSGNLAGSTTFRGQRSGDEYSYSLPNNPTTAVLGRSYSTRIVGRSNSRSTASCSSASRGSSPSHSSHEKCSACDFDVLIVAECPGSTVPHKEKNTDLSFNERLIN